MDIYRVTPSPVLFLFQTVTLSKQWDESVSLQRQMKVAAGLIAARGELETERAVLYVRNMYNIDIYR